MVEGATVIVGRVVVGAGLAGVLKDAGAQAVSNTIHISLN